MRFLERKNIGKIERYIIKGLSKRPLHFSLIDPDPAKISMKRIGDIAATLKKFGTDAILIGGSDNISNDYVDHAIIEIKNNYKHPVILYPGNISGVSKHADAILFMSLLNSEDPLWLSRLQAEGALIIKKFKIEPIPMAYLIVEPGMKAGMVGKADLIKDPQTAVKYALAAQYLGMRFVYLEAGSGAHRTVPIEIIKAVRKETDIKLIVGGGIKTAESTREILEAGADIIVTGTILEDEKSIEKAESIIKAVRSFKT